MLTSTPYRNLVMFFRERFWETLNTPTVARLKLTVSSSNGLLVLKSNVVARSTRC